MNERAEAMMRTIYARLLISAVLIVAMLASGALTPQRDGIDAVSLHVDAVP
jgi:hypothetical protein